MGIDIDDWFERPKRVRFIRTEPIISGWRQFVDKDDTPSTVRKGEELLDVLPPEHSCDKSGCIICEGKITHRVFMNVMVESQPRRMVPTPLKAPRHKKRGWMVHGYHRRIQKKWDKQVQGKTIMAPAMETRVLSVSRGTFQQIVSIYQSKRNGRVQPPPFERTDWRPILVTHE